jgi:hypothetical protein
MNCRRADNDGDGFTDFLDDLGCLLPDALTEDPGFDVTGDGIVDRYDVDAIFARRNTPAGNPSDPHDVDGDGMVTVLDSRACTLECDNPGCEPPSGFTGGCGLLGLEGLLPIGLALALHGRRRGHAQKALADTGKKNRRC